MLNIKPLAALAASWNGSSKGKASRLSQRKGGPLAAARANVDRVHRQVADFERSCVWHGVDETDHTRRCVDGFYAAVRHHERALTGFSEDDVEAMDSLERASGNLVAAASTLYAIDPALFRAKMGVELMSAVRGLDSKEAFERYLADLELIAEDRRARAAFFKERREEGYTDANGKEYSPADLAEKAGGEEFGSRLDAGCEVWAVRSHLDAGCEVWAVRRRRRGARSVCVRSRRSCSSTARSSRRHAERLSPHLGLPPSTLQPCTPFTTLQPFNPSTLRPFDPLSLTLTPTLTHTKTLTLTHTPQRAPSTATSSPGS